jgi:hypothetical protein
MAIAQPSDPQMPGNGTKPPLGNTLNANPILKTLNLHANAINTILCQVHALETQLRMRPEPPSPEPSEPSVTPNSSARPDWLEAALKRSGPEDGKPFIYFLHIPKTSGLSFRCFLSDAFGEAKIAPFQDWQSVLNYSGSAGDWKVWSGHFGGMLPFILPSWPRIVTILRDPVDRTISHINHVKREPTHSFQRYAKGMSVLELCRHPRFRCQLDNYQARHLASLAFAQAIFRRRGSAPLDFLDAALSLDPQYGLLDAAIRAMSEIDMVGIAEAHHQSLCLFAHTFNMPAPTQAHDVNKAEPSQLKREDLLPEELECIQELTQIDQLVYDSARQRFERECRKAKITPHFKEPEASPVAGAGVRYLKCLRSFWSNSARRTVSSRAAALALSKVTEGRPRSTARTTVRATPARRPS